MLRRSRIFKHLFLDVATHPNLIFRSFRKALDASRVSVTPPTAGRRAADGDESFAIPTEYTVFLNRRDYAALCQAGEEKVLADLTTQFRAFLASSAGKPYNIPGNQDVALRLAVDTELGLEPNEYYFAWPRRSSLGVIGRLDLFVRGERVESFDVGAAVSLGIGTTPEDDVRLDRIADQEVHLPPGVSLRIGREGDCLALVNRSRNGVPIVVDAVAVKTGAAAALRDGSRIAVGRDISLSFAAEAPEPVPPVLKAPTREDLEEVLGLLGLSPEEALEDPGRGQPAVAAPASAPVVSAPPALAALEVIGSILTTQMFDHAPKRTLCLGSSPRCHIVLKGSGVRPVHAELTYEEGRLYLVNRSGRRSVHVGPLGTPLRPGTRQALEFGETIRMGEVRLRLDPPTALSGEKISQYFGANYLGNLAFDPPQDRLVIDAADAKPLTIGRDAACHWALPSPYLWPTQAELLPLG